MMKTHVSRLALFLIIGISLLLLQSCPKAIDEELVLVVEDTFAPVLTVTSPTNNSLYKGTVTVAGSVTDSSVEEADGLGTLKSISFTVSDASVLDRTITFETDGTYSVEPADDTFSYNGEDGTFGFAFSTVGLSGVRILEFVIEDMNGNTTEKELTLFADDSGPFFDISSPEDQTQWGSHLTIEGILTNSESDPGTDLVSSFECKMTFISETIDFFTEDTSDDYDFTWDQSTGAFTVIYDVPSYKSGNLGITLTAEDLNGYEAENKITLFDSTTGPPILFDNAGAISYLHDYPNDQINYPEEQPLEGFYTTSNYKTITFSGVVNTENGFDQSSDFIIITDTGSLTGDIGADTNPGSPTYGDFSFSVDLSSIGGGLDPVTGDVSISMRVYDDLFRVSRPRFVFQQDDQAAVFQSISVASDNSYIDVTSNEGIWSNDTTSSPVTGTDFNVYVDNGVITVSLSSVKLPDSETELLASDPAGGETTLRYFLSGNPDLLASGDELIRVLPSGGAAIFDRAGNTSSTTVGDHPYGDVPLNDRKPPAVSVVSAVQSSGWYNQSTDIDIAVQFDEVVSVTGNPRLQLNVDAGETKYAVYNGGTGTDTLNFRYNISDGDNTLPVGTALEIASASIDLNNGSINDLAGNTCDPDVSGAGGISGDGIVIDTAEPTGYGIGTVSATGGTQRGGYWNSTNTAIQVYVPLNSGDISLDTGTIQLRANVENGGWEDLGAAAAEVTNRAAGFQYVSEADTVFEALSGTLQENDDVAFNAIVTDRAGNTTTYTATGQVIHVDQDLPGFSIQYYDDIVMGAVDSMGDNPRLGETPMDPYYLKITADEPLSTNPVVDIDAEGSNNDITNDPTISVGGNDYQYERYINVDGSAEGFILEDIDVTATDAAGNTATDVDPTDEAAKAAFTDTVAPTFTIQYYSDSGFTTMMGDGSGNDPYLKEAVFGIDDPYYLLITSNEALSSPPTIEIDTMPSVNSVGPVATVWEGGNQYSYERYIEATPPSDGTIREDIQIEGTDLVGNTNTVDPDNEATKAAFPDTVAPTISNLGPTENVNNTEVSYTLNETCQSGSIEWDDPGSTIQDPGAPHGQALAGSELDAGNHFNITLTNDPTLNEGTEYTITFNATDLAGNSTPDNTYHVSGIFYDTMPPGVVFNLPLDNASVNHSTISYELTGTDIASGEVEWAQTGGTSAPTSTATLTSGQLTEGTHSNVTLTPSPALTSGAIYTITVTATDQVGNPGSDNNENITYDNTPPNFGTVGPATGSYVNSTAVSYTLSEDIDSGTITWTRTGGELDGGSPHEQSLTGSELDEGAFSGTITSAPTLVNGAVYTIEFDGEDLAGNTATTQSVTGITYDTTPPVISSISPVTGARVNTTVVGYTLSEVMSNVHIRWRGDGTDPQADITGAGDLTTGAHSNVAPSYSASFVNGRVYEVEFTGTDRAGNSTTAVVESTNVTYDTAPPVITNMGPTSGSSVNHTQVSYTLSGTATSGTITWTRTSGATDGNSPHEQTLIASELTNGNHFNITLDDDPTLVDGTTYTIYFDAADEAGNDATQKSVTGIEYDISAPVFSGLSPATDSYVNHKLVSYTLNEDLASGSVTWTEDGTSLDSSDPHVESLDSGQRTAGAHTDVNLNPSLVSGAKYKITFNGTDDAGNSTTTGTYEVTGITYDTGSPSVDTDIADPNPILNTQTSFAITLNYSETMDDSVNPTVVFDGSGEDLISLGILDDPPSYSWENGDTRCVVTYGVVDKDETISDVDVRVTGAKDLAGNTQSAHDHNNWINVAQTQNPSIISMVGGVFDGSFNLKEAGQSAKKQVGGFLSKLFSSSPAGTEKESAESELKPISYEGGTKRKPAATLKEMVKVHPERGSDTTVMKNSEVIYSPPDKQELESESLEIENHKPGGLSAEAEYINTPAEAASQPAKATGAEPGAQEERTPLWSQLIVFAAVISLITLVLLRSLARSSVRRDEE